MHNIAFKKKSNQMKISTVFVFASAYLLSLSAVSAAADDDVSSNQDLQSRHDSNQISDARFESSVNYSANYDGPDESVQLQKRSNTGGSKAKIDHMKKKHAADEAKRLKAHRAKQAHSRSKLKKTKSAAGRKLIEKEIQKRFVMFSRDKAFAAQIRKQRH